MRATAARSRDVVEADRLGGRLAEALLQGVEDAAAGRFGPIGPQPLLVLPWGHERILAFSLDTLYFTLHAVV